MVKRSIIFLISLLLTFECKAFTSETNDTQKQPDVAQLSEALGHMIGKNLLEMGVQLDIAKVVKGLKDANQGKNSPLSESECVAAISSAQETVFKEKAAKNLKAAETFLKDQQDKKGIVTKEDGKIQYMITQEGKGNVVEEHSTPVIKYSGRFLNGEEFGSSKEGTAMPLDDLIPGMKLGMLGMKEGEKRTVYIHPTLGYGTAGMLPPNSLLCFDVEVIKVDAAPETAKHDPESIKPLSEDEGDLL